MPPSTDPGVGIFPRCLMIIRIAVDRQLSLTVLKHGGEWQKIDRWRNSLILSRTPFLQFYTKERFISRMFPKQNIVFSAVSQINLETPNVGQDAL